MRGTLVNVAGIIVGSMLGLLFKRGIPEHINSAILKIQGLAVVIIGLNGLLSSMLTVDSATGKLVESGGLLLLISLTLGCFAGEILRIDDRINGFGRWVEKKIHSDGFARGFVAGSLLYCVGALAIIGPINEGLSGDSGILYMKAIIDCVVSVFLAASLGAGVLFASVPTLVVQSIPALLARQLSPFISDQLLSTFCMTGYAIVICIGLNFLCGTKIKVANLLPSLIIPVSYYFIALV